MRLRLLSLLWLLPTRGTLDPLAALRNAISAVVSEERRQEDDT
ncbi:MAG: hypothetical protein AB1425_17330 [Actinomycetota bacterium]